MCKQPNSFCNSAVGRIHCWCEQKQKKIIVFHEKMHFNPTGYISPVPSVVYPFSCIYLRITFLDKWEFTSPLTGGVCLWATNDNTPHLQDVCNGGSGSQPAMQVHRWPWAFNTLGQSRWEVDWKHIENNMLWEWFPWHSQGLRQGRETFIFKEYRYAKIYCKCARSMLHQEV